MRHPRKIDIIQLTYSESMAYWHTPMIVPPWLYFAEWPDVLSRAYPHAVRYL